MKRIEVRVVNGFFFYQSCQRCSKEFAKITLHPLYKAMSKISLTKRKIKKKKSLLAIEHNASTSQSKIISLLNFNVFLLSAGKFDFFFFSSEHHQQMSMLNQRKPKPADCLQPQTLEPNLADLMPAWKRQMRD